MTTDDDEQMIDSEQVSGCGCGHPNNSFTETESNLGGRLDEPDNTATRLSCLNVVDYEYCT